MNAYGEAELQLHVFSTMELEGYERESRPVITIRRDTVKFANSPPCACRGSTGQKP